MKEGTSTDKQLAEAIGRGMRRGRRALGLTQQAAADTIGVSSEFFARIERGHALPSVITLAKVADALRVSGDELLGFTDGIRPIELANEPANRSDDPPEVRRAIRRVRTASRGTIRLVNLLVKLLEAEHRGEPEEVVDDEDER